MARGRRRGIWILAGLCLAPQGSCHLHRAAPVPELGELVIELPRTESNAPGSVLYLESPMDPLIQDTGRLIEIVSTGAPFRAPPSVVQSGDRIRFVNRGALAHRIFITDEAGRRERLVPPQAHSAELPITRSGEHRFYCSLHPDESVLLFATPSSHFVIPNGETRYTIRELPGGVYGMGWWSESGDRRLGTVEIEPGRAVVRALPVGSGPPDTSRPPDVRPR